MPSPEGKDPVKQGRNDRERGFRERETGEERESYEKKKDFDVINLSFFLCNNINKRNKIK